MNKHWGYNKDDKDFKTVKQLVHYLVRATGIGGNLLLNVGPPPGGAFQPEVIERLRGVGKWTNEYGESIYRTRGGPMPERNWGVMTHTQDQTAYVHLLESFGTDELLLPVTGDVESVTLFPSGKRVDFVLEDYLKVPLRDMAQGATGHLADESQVREADSHVTRAELSGATESAFIIEARTRRAAQRPTFTRTLSKM